MDSSLSSVVTRSCKSKYCYAPVYNRVYEQYNNDNSIYNRSYAKTDIWGRSVYMVRQ